jgi:hypothetical protein
MAKPVGREDMVWHPDELLLRFAFMGEVSDRATVVAFLEAFEREASGYARELKSFLDAMPARGLPTGRLAMENGWLQHQTQARWARRALAGLRRSK